MATTVIGSAGTSCTAGQVKWLGHSAAPEYDYTDVACADGHEYVLRSPAPGTQGQLTVLSCQDADALGARCELTAGGAVEGAMPKALASATRPDLEWFKKAFAANGFACDVKKGRIIGRESIKQRWVAEFQCPQHPQGVVVYAPSAADPSAKFEQIDCRTAAQRHLSCKFPHTQ